LSYLLARFAVGGRSGGTVSRCIVLVSGGVFDHDVAWVKPVIASTGSEGIACWLRYYRLHFRWQRSEAHAGPRSSRYCASCLAGVSLHRGDSGCRKAHTKVRPLWGDMGAEQRSFKAGSCNSYTAPASKVSADEVKARMGKSSRRGGDA